MTTTWNFLIFSFSVYAALQTCDSISCFECHGTSVSDVTSSCWETVNSEHARFVSLVECPGSCSITVLNHASIGLRDFTRACEPGCEDSCFDTPFGTKLCKYCCSTHRCNAVVPTHTPKSHDNVTQVSTENMKMWLEKHLSKARHHSAGPSIKFHTRHELTKLMEEFTPKVEKQEIDVSEIHEEDRAPENFRSFIRTTTRGFNIIGTSPGISYKTKHDEIIVVMAHYDTASTGTPGVNDNGSGVVALLELARLLGGSACNRNYTVIFVITDFKENGVYRTSTSADSCLPQGVFVHNVGSSNFVCHRLMPHLKQFGGKLKMAINLDSLLNVVDSSRNDQWPRETRNALQSYIPHGVNFWKAVKKRSFSQDWWMVKSSTSAFRVVFNTKMESSSSLKSEDFLHLLLDTSAKNTRSSEMLTYLHADDCAPFHKVTEMELPCLTISDTGKLRGYMKRCYHQNCDDLTQVDEDKLQNLAKVTNTVWHFILALSGNECYEQQGFVNSLEKDQILQCDNPLIQKKRPNNMFVSATCARTGTIFEMCPTLGDGIWGIINGESAWIPRKYKLGKAPLWFQVDFGKVLNITAIAVQGVRRTGYVRSYMVSSSNNERDWEWHIPAENQWDDTARRAEIRGSTSGNGVEKRLLNPSISARFVRIYPRWWRRRIVLRAQMYGCEL
uniref:uncharacterized protein LOC120334152 n=1 Tax=Styela clava TaxID=7725 RepID=UPI0019397F8D|nr:uncharacterized protein LOC120334152 [Styela clava]